MAKSSRSNIPPLATMEGVFTLTALLIMDGSMCPKCGHGTRKTSKNWRRCKQCDERIHLVPATKELVESNAKILNREINKTMRELEKAR